MGIRGQILLVTVGKETGKQLAEFLGSMGHSVTLAHDHTSAWERFAQAPPDLVLIDALPREPQLLELARMIRQDAVGAVAPLAILASKEISDEQLKPLQADIVLRRPLKQRELSHEIERVILDGRDPLLEALRTCGPAHTRQDGDRQPLPTSGFTHIGPNGDEGRVLWNPPLPSGGRREKRRPQVPDKGLFEDVGMPELFSDLYLSGFHGQVTFNHNKKIKKTIWINGSIVYVDSQERSESLGQILVREGIISERDCLISIANMHTYATRQGGALIEMGVISPLQLMEALRLQAWEKALSLFSWFSGGYFKQPGKVSRERYTAFALDTPSLIRKGIERSYQPVNLKALFDKVQTARFEIDKNALQPIGSLSLGALEREFVKLYDGARTVEQIVFTSPLELTCSLQMMFWLLSLAVLKPVDDQGREQLERLEQAASKSLLNTYYSSLDGLADSAAADMSTALIEKIRLKAKQHPPIEFRSAQEPADGDQPEQRPAPPEQDPQLRERIAKAQHDIDQPADQQPPADERFVGPAEATEIKPPSDEPKGAARTDEAQTLSKTITAKFLTLEHVNHYELLGLSQNDTLERIERSYSRMRRRFSVKRLGKITEPELIEKIEAITQRIEAAFLVLGDPKQRDQYDRELIARLQESKRKQAATLVAESSFKRAIEALKLGEFRMAIEALGKALELFPNEAEYHAYLGWALFNDRGLEEKERVKRAKQELSLANDLNPKSELTCLFLGKMLKVQGKLQAAAQMMAQALDRNPRSLEARREMEMLDYWKPEDFQMPQSPTDDSEG
ncbi:MAG: hypothetical protein P9M14_04765 [Candidatus Alcyoniella australis]|nr:hypothetical protein [Candidatus Alcyoniella australis]